jgi:hypothetical protein
MVGHDGPVLLVACLAAVPFIALMLLTGRGQRRRGGGAAVVVPAGVFFPVTWVVWYLVDRRSVSGSPTPL